MWSSLSSLASVSALVHPVLNAPNVLTVKLPPCGTAMRRAKEHFDLAILPHLEEGLIEALEEQPLPCRSLRHATHGNFFVMKGGSSTDPAKSKSSDLAWISVDDSRSKFRGIAYPLTARFALFRRRCATC